MNIYHLIQSLEHLDLAAQFTIDATERDKLIEMAKQLRLMLQKHGVFIG